MKVGYSMSDCSEISHEGPHQRWNTALVKLLCYVIYSGQDCNGFCRLVFASGVQTDLLVELARGYDHLTAYRLRDDLNFGIDSWLHSSIQFNIVCLYSGTYP